MPSKRHLRVLYKLLLIVLCAAGVWVFFRFILRLVLPFIIALLLAHLMEPLIRRLSPRLPRTVCSAVLTITVISALTALLFWLGSLIIGELNRLTGVLPDMLASLPDAINDWKQKIEIFIDGAPVSLQEFLRSSVEGALSGGASIPATVYTAAAGIIKSAAVSLPRTLLFLVATVFSTFLISSEYPKLASAVMKPFSQTIRDRILKTQRHLTSTLGKWLKVQGILMVITFIELLIGLLVLRTDYALLLSAVTAVLDALPALGVGLVLIPWGIFCLLSGATARGIGLLLMYAIITLARGMIEPRLVGKQIGLPPLLTLMSMYAGFLLWGVAGMILGPFAAMLIKQMAEWGWFTGKE